MLRLLSKPQAIQGYLVPRRRFTGWAVIYFLLFFCLPVLGICFMLDFLLYLVFTEVFGASIPSSPTMKSRG